jgi:serine/threonine protein kinase
MKIKFNGLEYVVLEQLSLPHRGRWKVKESRPNAPKKLFTLIVLEDTKETQQFLASVESLPQDIFGIPRFIDSQISGGKIFLLVDWIEGVTLEYYFRRIQEGRYQSIGPYDAIRRIRSLAFLCGSLHRDCRIIHADLKPANLVLPSDRLPIGIIDFGSSWQIEGTNRRAEGDGFDPHYAAPELINGRSPIDGRADQFSMGVILYKMLTGKIPYDGLGGQAGTASNSVAEMEQIYVAPSQISQTMGTLPPPIKVAIDDLVRRCLRLEPDNRFATMQQLWSELDKSFSLMKNRRLSFQDARQDAKSYEKRSLWSRIFASD